MAGPYASIASSAPSMPASVLEEELMDFENAATHFNTDEWSLSELDEEALQGIVSGKPNTGRDANQRFVLLGGNLFNTLEVQFLFGYVKNCRSTCLGNGDFLSKIYCMMWMSN